MLKRDVLKIIYWLTLHALFVFGLVVGYDLMVAWILSLLTELKSGALNFWQLTSFLLSELFRLDFYIVAGISLFAALLAYDAHLLVQWWTSFQFTSKSTKCRSCQVKMVRIERRAGDRLLSVFLSVKRYMCLGCGRQYLVPDSRKEVSQEIPRAAQTSSIKSK